MKGTVLYQCSICGRYDIRINCYVESIFCPTCKKNVELIESERVYLRQFFSEDGQASVAQNAIQAHQNLINCENMVEKEHLQEKIFTILNLSEADRKYVSVEEDTVYFTFPLKIDLGLWCGDKKMLLDAQSQNRFYDSIRDTVELALFKDYGFRNLTLCTVRTDPRPESISRLEVFKDVNTEEEIKEAVLQLVKFKRRHGIS